MCSGRAFGDELPEPIHLRFAVEEGLASQCPDQAQFMDRLHVELPRLTLAPEGAHARTFDVRIRRARAGLHGEVAVTSKSGASYTRSVEARDCATLTRALAVVAALASNAVPEEPSQEAEPAVPPAIEDTTEPVPPPPPRPAPRKRKRAAVVKRERPAWNAGAGLGTEFVTGSLPRSAMGYRGYVDVQRAFSQNALGGRLSFAYAGAPLPGALLNVRIQTWTARLEACASRRIFAPLSLEGCAAATSGIFEASSLGQGRDETNVDLWLAFGLGVRARWHLAGPVYSELFSNVSVPTTRYDAVSKDTVAVVHFAVSQVVGEVGLGLGIKFAGP
ncbi:hypothetical protein AKJ09_04492 [Labilithrix luteola]|uniref:Uncharacterized protein n=1 Tax=Labilithrix luteola TaxID=1391654 RepID=A0A0K1PWD2_9BACT|nr:hypothetical protein AKJ09_04492 [Labilithrix luteola]